MKKSKVAVLVIAALVAGLTLGGIGIASAAGRSANNAVVASHSGTPLTGTASPVATLSTLTGLSVPEIMALRAQGESLATIATNNGIDPAVLVDQILAARKANLDSLVSAGRLTAEQELAILDHIRIAVQRIVDAVPGVSAMPSRVPTSTPSVPTTTGPRAGMMTSATVGPHMVPDTHHAATAPHVGTTAPHMGTTAPQHMTPSTPAAPAPVADPTATPAAPSTTHHSGSMMGSGSGSTSGMMGPRH